MIRGLVIRVGAVLMGIAPFMFLLRAVEVAPRIGGIALIVYVAAGSCYLGHYCVKHGDEIPVRSN